MSAMIAPRMRSMEATRSPVAGTPGGIVAAAVMVFESSRRTYIADTGVGEMPSAGLLRRLFCEELRRLGADGAMERPERPEHRGERQQYSGQEEVGEWQRWEIAQDP